MLPQTHPVLNLPHPVGSFTKCLTSGPSTPFLGALLFPHPHPILPSQHKHTSPPCNKKRLGLQASWSSAWLNAQSPRLGPQYGIQQMLWYYTYNPSTSKSSSATQLRISHTYFEHIHQHLQLLPQTSMSNKPEDFFSVFLFLNFPIESSLYCRFILANGACLGV